MAGTVLGGRKAAATNKDIHGEDFYRRIGAMGGRASGTGGFYYAMKHGLTWHREAGAKGGRISRRPKKESA